MEGGDGGVWGGGRGDARSTFRRVRDHSCSGRWDVSGRGGSGEAREEGDKGTGGVCRWG